MPRYMDKKMNENCILACEWLSQECESAIVALLNSYMGYARMCSSDCCAACYMGVYRLGLKWQAVEALNPCFCDCLGPST